MHRILRLLRLPTALLALTLSYPGTSAAATLAARDSSSTSTPNITLPAPISIHPDENWDGIDGAWSSFTLRVGTPQQFVRTFVSWTSYQTWVVLPQGCQAAANQGACAETRGDVFNISASSTWQDIGIYDLWIERRLGYDGNAEFGYDTVGLGGVGEEGPTVKNTTVGGLAVEDFYLGLFGINPKPTNFTSFSDPSPSFMTLLKEQKAIPSVSFGYTAGAPYRFSGDEYASLTLGGYDRSLFYPNDVTFGFAADNERDVVVAVQSISTPSQIASNPQAVALLPSPIYAYLDATFPQIWLPIEACAVFEDVFGLTYDNTTELYLVNNTLHEQLLQRNASITFQLGPALQGAPTLDITLPYAAFDLQASPPYQGLQNQTTYFPLRRAANESQYTIGRAFFQEAYLAVDYEAQTFNVSQRRWQQGASPHLVAIPPFTGAATSSNSTAGGTSSGASHLSGGAIAGIVVGALALLALLAVLLMWLFKRRSRAAAAAQREKPAHPSPPGSSHYNTPNASTRGLEPTVYPKAELEGSGTLRPISEDADIKALLSAGRASGSGSGSPRTPRALSGSGFSFGLGGATGRRGSSSYSPTTPSADGNTGGTGNGTHSSTGTGTLLSSSVVSPLYPSGSDSAYDTSHSREHEQKHPVYEMAGDMPIIREKDGRQLSEKEALAHREMVYNGVGVHHNTNTNNDSPTPPTSVSSPSPTDIFADPHPHTAEHQDGGGGGKGPRRVSPEEVVMSGAAIDGGTGASSWFEGDSSSGGEEHGQEKLSRSPRDFTAHRAFSFEEERRAGAGTGHGLEFEGLGAKAARGGSDGDDELYI